MERPSPWWSGPLVQRSAAWIYAALFAWFAATAFARDIITDLQHHVTILDLYLRSGSFPVPPLFYAVVHLLDLALPGPVEVAMVVTLSAAAWLKFRLIENDLRNAGAANLAPAALTGCVLLAAPVLVPGLGSNWYLGYFSSAVHHNSTILFVLPFCILLHDLILRYMERPERAIMIRMMLWGTVIVLIKPSYLFVLLPVLPVFLWLDGGNVRSRNLPLSGFVVLMAFLIAILFAVVYKYSALDDLYYGGGRSSITIAPFKEWLWWTDHPVANLLLSFPFVVLHLLFHRQAWRSDRSIRLAGWLVVASMVLYLLVAETGPREHHGNFYWQIPITLLLLYISIVRSLIRAQWPPFRLRLAHLPLKDHLLLAVGVAQVLSGMLYVRHIIVAGTYH